MIEELPPLAALFAEHDALGCCDSKTLEHVWQSIQKEREDKPFVVRQFEGKPWVPLHEAARLHDAHQRAELMVAALRNEAALRATPEPPDLSAAWRAVEEALPEGTLLLSRWEPGIYRAVWSGEGGSPRHSVDGPTPTAALLDLASAVPKTMP